MKKKQKSVDSRQKSQKDGIEKRIKHDSTYFEAAMILEENQMRLFEELRKLNEKLP